MRTRRGLSLGFVVWAGLALLAAPALDAFHGAAYTARGTATLQLTDEAYDAALRWSGLIVVGPSGVRGGTYILDLVEEHVQVQGQPVELRFEFAGRETFRNVHFLDDCVEYADYLGQTIAWGTVGARGDPVFEIAGWQYNDLCSGVANMHYEGHYLAWRLVLDVWGPPGA